MPGYLTKTLGFIKSLSGYCSVSIFPLFSLLYICESAFFKKTDTTIKRKKEKIPIPIKKEINSSFFVHSLFL